MENNEKDQKKEIKTDSSDIKEVKIEKVSDIETPKSKKSEPKKISLTLSKDLLKFSSVSKFLKKYPYLGLIVSVAFLSCFAFFISTLNFGFPVADELGMSNAENIVFRDAFAEVSAKYPTLADDVKYSRAYDILEKAKQENTYTFTTLYPGSTSSLDDLASQSADVFREEYFDNENHPYPLIIDSFYWLHLVENKEQTGMIGDAVVDGEPYIDTLAPNGDAIPSYNQFYPQFVVFLSSILPLSSFAIMSFYPVVVSILVSLLVFFAVRRLVGEVGGVFAGILVVLLPAISGDVLFLQIDTDAFIVLFGVLLSWLFVELLLLRSLKKSLIVSGLIGFFVGVFSLFWYGWFFVFDLILFASIKAFFFSWLYAAGFFKKFSVNRILHVFKFMKPSLLRSNFNVRKSLLSLIVLFVSSFIFVSLFSGSVAFFGLAFSEPFNANQTFDYPILDGSLWPNVFTTVAELSAGSIASAVFVSGGWLVFLFTLSGLMLFLLDNSPSLSKKFKLGYFFSSFVMWCVALILGYFVFSSDWFVYIFSLLLLLPFVFGFYLCSFKGLDPKHFSPVLFLILSFILSFFAASTAVRFGIFSSIFVPFVFGVAVGSFFIFIPRVLSSFGISLNVSKVLVLICFVLLLFVPLNLVDTAVDSVKGSRPLITDSMFESLEFIKLNSKDDAIITSWWDYGHPYRYISDRSVTFDGASQVNPQAHWVGKLLLADEREGLGILRMLDCGGNNAFNSVFNVLNSSNSESYDTNFVLSKRIVDSLVTLDSSDARALLSSNNFSDEDIDTVLSYSHCSPPEGFLIVSSDMVNKAPVWGHFGSWDFDKAAFWSNKDNLSSISSLDVNFNSEIQNISSFRDLDRWLADFPGLSHVQITDPCVVSDNIIDCSFDFVQNPTSFTIDIESSSLSYTGYPVDSVVYLNNGEVSVASSGESNGLSFVLAPDKNVFISESSDIADSLFTRLFFFNGIGVDSFSKFTESSDIFGQRFTVYKAIW